MATEVFNQIEQRPSPQATVQVVEEKCENHTDYAIVFVRGKDISEADGPYAKQAALNFARQRYNFTDPGIDRPVTPPRWVEAETGKQCSAASKNVRCEIAYKVRPSTV